MTQRGLSIHEILTFIPQQKPFRFVDRIVFVNENEIEGVYTFKHDEVFYAGHFPGRPLTPGVILLECMAQVSVVAFGIYLLSFNMSHAELRNVITVMTDAQLEIFKPIYPGTQVTIKAEKIFWRFGKLRAKAEMYDERHECVATSIASGKGVVL